MAIHKKKSQNRRPQNEVLLGYAIGPFAKEKVNYLEILNQNHKNNKESEKKKIKYL